MFTTAKYFVHGMKMFDKANLAFTTIRLIEIFKLINWILSLCLLHRRSEPCNVLQRIFHSKFTSPLFSILNSDAILWDLILLNTIMYKCLFTLENVVRFRPSPLFEDSFTNLYTIYSFILIFIFGGLSNFLAEYISSRPVVDGMNGSVAACLGYNLQVAPHTPLVTLFDVDLKPGEILSFVFITYVTHAMIGSNSVSSISRIITWIVGASLGVFLYELQLQI